MKKSEFDRRFRQFRQARSGLTFPAGSVPDDLVAAAAGVYDQARSTVGAADVELPVKTRVPLLRAMGSYAPRGRVKSAIQAHRDTLQVRRTLRRLNKLKLPKLP